VTRASGTSDGEPLPELAVRPELIDAVMYAAAMWEFQRLHFDHDWARREGLPGPIVQGPLLGNYLARAVTAAMPPGTELERLAWRNRAVVGVGEPLRVGGTLAPTDANGRRDVELWVVDGSGTTVVSGSARLRPAQQPRSGGNHP
jgi:hydroxyacyl-ACP dehydratase HTD2-like protein with hotdog domain